MKKLDYLKKKRKTLLNIQKQMATLGYKKVDYALDSVVLEISEEICKILGV